MALQGALRRKHVLEPWLSHFHRVRADYGYAQVAERVRRLAPQVARRGGDGVAGHAPPQQPLDDGPALAAVGAEDEVPHASTRRGEAMSSPALLPRNVLLRESART